MASPRRDFRNDTTRRYHQHVSYSIKGLAEREGFEPPIPVKVYTLSRRAPSATRPSLRAVNSHFHFTKEVHWSSVDRLDFTELSLSQTRLLVAASDWSPDLPY
jgi:hypothetical protein